MPDIASLFVFPIFLLFARVGAAVMVYPGLSDISIPTRARLLLALTLTFILFPPLETVLPNMPPQTSELLLLLGTEIFIGISLAIGARMFMAALHLAGELIGFTSGLHAASLFDPRSGASTAAPALFLTIVAITLIFTANLHHYMIQGMVESYTVFPPGHMPPLEDTTWAVAGVMGDVFRIGIKIAAPVMTVGFLTYIGFGIFNRLIPQLHVFFVALPVTIVAGIFLLGVALAGMITLFMDELTAHLVLFAREG